MDIYEGIQSEIISATRFDENSNLSTTYFGRVDKENKNKLRAEESFPISECKYTSGRLLDGTGCQLLLDMGAQASHLHQIHSICIASHYIHCKICLKDSKNTSRKWSTS